MVEDWSFDGPLASNYVKNELSYDRFGGYKFLGSDRDSFSGLEGFSMFGADDPFNVGTESGSVNSNGNNNNNNNNNNNSNNNNNGGARRMSGIGNFFSGFTGSLSSPSNSFSGPSSALPQLHDFPSWELSSRNQSQQLSLPSVQQSQSQSQSQSQQQPQSQSQFIGQSSFSPSTFNKDIITSDFDLNSIPLSSRSPIQRGLTNRSSKGSFLNPPPLFPSPSSSFSSSNQSSSIPSSSLSLEHNVLSTPISPTGGQFKTFDNLSSKNDNNLNSNNNNNPVSFQNSKSITQGEKGIFPSSRIQPFALPSSITSTSQSPLQSQSQSQLNNDIFGSGISSNAYPIPTHLISIMDNNNNNNSGRLSPAQNLRNIPTNKIKSINPLSLPSPSSSASPSSSFSSLTSSSASSSPLSSISTTPSSSSLSSNALAQNSISSSSINPLATITSSTPTTTITTATAVPPPTKTRKAPNYPRRRRKRLVWTEALEDAFLKAMKELGDPNTVTPREILEKMSVPGLSRQNISSHLQNHRLKLSRKNHGQQSRRNRERLLDNYLATLSSVTGTNGFNQNDNSTFNQNDDNSLDGLSPSSSFSSSSNMDSNDQQSESSLNIIDQDDSGQKSSLSDSSLPLPPLPLSLPPNTTTSTNTTSFPSNSSGFSMGVNFLE